MQNGNLQIVQRLLELSTNTVKWSVYPNDYNKEHLYLSNILNYAAHSLENEFSECFKKAVGEYTSSLKENKRYGWFYSPDKLVWKRTQINQITYAIYGKDYVHEIKFNEHLGKAAYKDLINQVDRTALMTPAQIRLHELKCNKIAKKIVDKILAEEKLDTKV